MAHLKTMNTIWYKIIHLKEAQAYNNILKITKNTQKCSGEPRSKLMRGHTHFLFIRRTVFI